ncbi:MAG: glycosyltransferase, partial [Candidatus Peregrinibacteria bacterium]|nr:glycosyltransferase [Candidatus Peregrinibacteria bacterium]
REAFGLTVLEAMASGTIAVATNNGGTVDIIQDGVTGYLIPPSSAQAIYERLSIILKNPQQKADIEREAQHRLREKFTAEKMAEATLAVYQEVC